MTGTDGWVTTPAPSQKRQDSAIAFWNVNVPEHLHTKECPEFLQYAFHNDKDRRNLSTPDELYHRQTWAEVQQFVRENRLNRFQRVPSQLWRYREFYAGMLREYGSVTRFMLEQRLKWTDIQPRASPFQDPIDLKILYNDWPYGVDERIAHLVVWTKFTLAEDPETDDLTREARSLLQKYIDETFVSTCGTENVLWFRNPRSLKTIPAIEHIHVMLFDPPPSFLKEITAGDVPLVQKSRKVDGS